ncbi:MAG: long-chain fatty acid--CoA ligase [Gammaproteobacteria bacterium]|nr:long-chain fatty acid--CoA ligase [Gammaproteobacteria bacterium]
MALTKDIITPEEAGTLAGLFKERARRSPDSVAYRYFDEAREQWSDTSWAEMRHEISRWQAALEKEGLDKGSRVALMVRNCREWVMYDQAALGLGMVTVPLYVDDRPENVAYIIQDSGSEVLLLMNNDQCRALLDTEGRLPTVKRIIVMGPVASDITDERVVGMHTWLPAASSNEMTVVAVDPGELASIVYTSGTTGRPKGVMLSHGNMLSNAYACAHVLDIFREDIFLSFLPMSHTLERTAGYYLTVMSGSTVAYARSVLQLAEDLLVVRPTILISVPRIYERVYNRISDQLEAKSPLARKLFMSAVDVGMYRFEYRMKRAPWHVKLLAWPILNALVAKKVRSRLGGRLRLAVSGGAPLAPPIANVFIGLGLDILQGYGLTESSPVISVNRPDANIPASIGTVINDVEVKIGDNDELLSRGPNTMLGYWNMPEATAETIKDGWLYTGDKARIDDAGHIYITGRIKEILVLANGEKVPPADMEMAIALDSLFDQVLVLGEGKPYLSALIVVNPEQWEKLCVEKGAVGSKEELLTNPALLDIVRDRIAQQISSFPGYAQIHQVTLDIEPWGIEEGLLTPSMKMRRGPIMEKYKAAIAEMYKGH